MTTPHERAMARVGEVFRNSQGTSAIYDFAVAAERGRLEALDVLEDCEWVDVNPNGSGLLVCPICDGVSNVSWKDPGHREGCALAACLEGER